MSFSICRIAKIKSSGVTGIQIHDRREMGVSHTNEDIDWSRTNENIDLLDQKEKFRTAVKNRIDELNLKRAPRKDATVMVQCLITSDKAFFEKMNKEEQVEFFKKSYDFIKDRYGKENMVSATIHFDESTPHMHVNFVPVTEDGRLSARDLFSPKQLRELQDDFNKYINDKGYDLDRGKKDSKRKHLKVEEYKLETRFAELKRKENEINNEMLKLEEEHKSLKNEINALKNDFEELSKVKTSHEEINEIKGDFGLLNKDKVKIKAEDYENLIKIAKSHVILEKQFDEIAKANDELLKKLDKYKNINTRLDYAAKEKQIGQLQKELKTMRLYLEKTNQTEKYKKFIESLKILEKSLNKNTDRFR